MKLHEFRMMIDNLDNIDDKSNMGEISIVLCDNNGIESVFSKKLDLIPVELEWEKCKVILCSKKKISSMAKY